MREFLLEKLECNKCGPTGFKIKNAKKNSREIVSGKIVCKKCGQAFAIRNGIADFLTKKTPEIESEQKGWEDYTKGEDKKFVLQLPFPKNVTADARAHWKQQAANFFQALELLKLKGTEDVLDIGAGRCWSTREIAKQCKRAVALDIVEKKYFGLECGELFFKKGIFFDRVLADMHSLPFANESFDAVFSTASFHHSSELKKLFAEAARVLKKGGILALTNEPVRGLLDRKKIDSKEIALGINEHKPSFLQWHNALKCAGFAPKYFFPRSIEQMLESGRVRAEKKYKLILGKAAARIASVKTIKKLILRANVPMQALVGVGLVCIAKKNR